MLIWGSDGNAPPDLGSRYDPVGDTWSAITSTGAPSARSNHTAIWTGKEMIVWGGTSLAATGLGDGARYDPRTNSWTPVSAAGAPSARYRHTAVWTGREMIIWGGLVPNPPGNAIPQNDGARYDP